MKTLSFIGSDKNAGKTTVLNYIYKKLHTDHQGRAPVCITSIGINGEDVDTYENTPKPLISIFRDGYFITAAEHLRELSGIYQVFHNFYGDGFNKLYVLGKSLVDFAVVLEGPNNKQALLEIKKTVETICSNGFMLIDGSIDRQFLAHPNISDETYFSVLVTERQEQLQKAEDLMLAFSLPEYTGDLKEIIQKNLTPETKALLLNSDGTILYHGRQIAFMDTELKNACLQSKNKHNILYLNGALTPSLFSFLAPFNKLSVVMENFTLYQNITIGQKRRSFKPELSLFNAVPVKKIFIKQQSETMKLQLPEKSVIHNLYRDNPDEIGI